MKDNACCPDQGPSGRCTFEAVLSVDERGQVVLPKEIRSRMGISTGEKLAAISWERGGRICCLMLYPVHQLSEPLRAVLAPMLKDLQNGVV